MYLNIPEEMRSMPHWVCWNLDTSKFPAAKVPISPVTEHNCGQNANEWSTFEHAWEFAHSEGLSGIGFQFSYSGFVGIDLDATDNPELMAAHDSIISWLNSYTEHSPSGKGRHIIVRGQIPHAVKCSAKRIEIYSHARYFTMTGDVCVPTQVQERTAELSQLVEWLSAGRQPALSTIQPALSADQDRSDEQVWIAAESAANGRKFAELWAGHTNGYVHSDGRVDLSAADQALINILAFHTQNYDQIKRMFRLSELGKRQKAFRDDYLERTINKALDRQVPTVWVKEGLASRENASQSKEHKSVATPVSHTVGRDVKSLGKPEGLLGDIAQYIYDRSPRPMWEASICASIGLMAGICGRAYQISGKGPNLYVSLLADTGRGKEAMSEGIDKLVRAAAVREKSILGFIGPNKIASGEGLLAEIARMPVPCCVSVIPEFGHHLKEIVSSRAPAHKESLRALYLDLYSKSGFDNHLGGKVFSDKEKKIPAIRAPGFSILGESTPRILFEAIDDDSVGQGLIPRFIWVRYKGNRPPANDVKNWFDVDEALVDRVAALASYALKINADEKFVEVKMDQPALSTSIAFRDECDAAINTPVGTSVVHELWNRAHLNALKLAALAAIGVCAHTPIIGRPEMVWAINLVRTGIEMLLDAWDSGEVGNPCNPIRQTADCKMMARSWTQEAGDIPEHVGGAGYVPLSWLRERLRTMGSFKKAFDPDAAIWRIVNNLEQEGYWHQIRLVRPGQDPSAKGIYYQLH